MTPRVLTFAQSPTGPDGLLVPAPPGEAYAADVARLNGREPVGLVDDAWLALAHALARAGSLPVAHRPRVLAAGAEVVEALLPPDAPPAVRDALYAAADGLRTLCTQLTREGLTLHRPLDRVGAAMITWVTAAVQQVVAQQEQAGVFLLAFSTLAAVRAAFDDSLDARAEGLLLAQQGRVARQLGALTTAAELYGAAARAARTGRAADVAARALLGGGALATVRGNYPEARALYRRALVAAERAEDGELRRAAHHGLLLAAFAARDVDTALAHGWAAVRGLSADAADERAEMLVNLGEVGRQAGEFRAALGACLSALELTDLPRLRLPALGTAALAAARLDERALLGFLARDVERTVARSGQPFENARALVELAEAQILVADLSAAEASASCAGALAGQGGFHEVAARADGVLTAVAAARAAVAAPGAGAAVTVTAEESAVPPAVRTPQARAVLRSLEALPASRRHRATAAW